VLIFEKVSWGCTAIGRRLRNIQGSASLGPADFF